MSALFPKLSLKEGTMPISVAAITVTSHSRPVLRRALITVAVAAAIGMLSCSDSLPPSRNHDVTYFGPTVPVASGSARAYVTLDGAGVPREIGLALTETALDELPSTAAEYVLVLPPQASATAFKHAVINWNPLGHPPAGVYTVPHFDFHFYTITNAQRAEIVVGDSALAAKMMRLPTAEFVPAGYLAGMASELMGLHWRDTEAPELKGAPFTKTFIYGSYDGDFIFAEPMVAMVYLETRPDRDETMLKLPTSYAVRGYHPTSYSVGYYTGPMEYRVALSGLVSR
jgi:hypothetical protein